MNYAQFDGYKRPDGTEVSFSLREDTRQLEINVVRNPNDSYPTTISFYNPLFGEGENVRYALAQAYVQGFKRADLLQQEINDAR